MLNDLFAKVFGQVTPPRCGYSDYLASAILIPVIHGGPWHLSLYIEGFKNCERKDSLFTSYKPFDVLLGLTFMFLSISKKQATA